MTYPPPSGGTPQSGASPQGGTPPIPGGPAYPPAQGGPAYPPAQGGPAYPTPPGSPYAPQGGYPAANVAPAQGGFGYGPPPQIPGGPPQPPSRPPHRGPGTFIAIGLGALATVAILVLGITLLVTNLSGGSSQTATRTSTTAPATTGDPSTDATGPATTDEDGDASGAPDATTYAIGEAMQRYVDAFNTRDVSRIRGTVCSEARTSVSAPTGQGTLVLDGLSKATVNGDVAQSRVVVHKELGSQRTDAQQVSASFRHEDSTWYYCPGAEPDITA